MSGRSRVSISMLWALLVRTAGRVIQRIVQTSMPVCIISYGWRRANSGYILIVRANIAIRLADQTTSSITQTQPVAVRGYISRIKQQLIYITTPHISQIKVRSTPIQGRPTVEHMVIVIFGASLMNGLVRR